MIPIFFSDLHLHNWVKYNQDGRRLNSQLKILEDLLEKALFNDSPLFFSGDLLHSPVAVSNSLLSILLPKLIDLFLKYPVELYGISGNHDLEGINTLTHRSPSYINTLANSIPNFHNLDFSSVELEDFVIFGIPYLTHNEGFNEAVSECKLVPGKKNILLCHTDFQGQKDTDGMVIGKGENINESLLSKFDLVMSGHIHKPGQVRSNVYSVGAPLQMRLSDMDGEFGYWLLKRGRLRFKEITWTPKFRLYSSESERDNDTDFWVKEPKANEEIMEQLEDELDFQDYLAIGRNYLEATKIKSRSKKLLLLEILKETERSIDD